MNSDEVRKQEDIMLNKKLQLLKNQEIINTTNTKLQRFTNTLSNLFLLCLGLLAFQKKEKLNYIKQFIYSL